MCYKCVFYHINGIIYCKDSMVGDGIDDKEHALSSRSAARDIKPSFYIPPFSRDDKGS